MNARAVTLRRGHVENHAIGVDPGACNRQDHNGLLPQKKRRAQDASALTQSKRLLLRWNHSRYETRKARGVEGENLLHLDAEKYREDGKENPFLNENRYFVPLPPPVTIIPSRFKLVPAFSFFCYSIPELIFLVGLDTIKYIAVFLISFQATPTAFISRAQGQML